MVERRYYMAEAEGSIPLRAYHLLPHAFQRVSRHLVAQATECCSPELLKIYSNRELTVPGFDHDEPARLGIPTWPVTKSSQL